MKNQNQSSIPAVLRYPLPEDQLAADALVTYESRGCVLVVGQDRRTVELGRVLNKQKMDVVVLITNLSLILPPPEGIVCLQGKLLSLAGFLGQFEVRIEGKEGPLNPALLCSEHREQFDIILDLAEQPYLPLQVTPLGYYAPGSDRDELQRAMIGLSALVGVFKKPKFFKYQTSLCAHQRYGIKGCRACLDVCPAEAISSDNDRIVVNPYLCQGCGTCMLTCPSGALSPNPELPPTPLQRLRVVLTDILEDAYDPCILLYDHHLDDEQLKVIKGELPDWIIPVRLQELGTAGIETWLAALAWGAGSVILMTGKTHVQHTVEQLRRQLDHARRMLVGMGYDAQRLRLIEGMEESSLEQAFSDITRYPSLGAADFNASNNKRNTIEKALVHLIRAASHIQDKVELASGAPFGELDIDQQKCTLCMGCVKVCPTTAVRSAGDVAQPKLGFVHTLCLQCGLCVAACPEQAIERIPRLLFDLQARETPRILVESPPFHCTSCGTPFTTKAIVELMTERLKDNPHFQGGGLERLKQCPDCRARENVMGQLRRLDDRQR